MPYYITHNEIYVNENTCLIKSLINAGWEQTSHLIMPDLYYIVDAPWHRLDDVNMNEILNIPNKIIDLANKDEITIIYYIPEYIPWSADSIKMINEQIEKVGLYNYKNIHVFLPFASDITTPDHIHYHTAWRMFYANIIEDNYIKEVNPNRRNKKITCLNRIKKEHRYYLVGILFNAGVIDSGYITYRNRYYNKSDITFDNNKNQIIDNFGHCFLEFDKNIPLLLNEIDNNHDDHHIVQYKFYNDAYWNIITETLWDNRGGVIMFFTEKTFKPIANLQPFVILSTSNSLRALRDLGYKTFGDFIDEGYDLILDHNERLLAVAALAIELANMSHDDHIKLMTQIKPILEHNQRVFFQDDIVHKLGTLKADKYNKI